MVDECEWYIFEQAKLPAVDSLIVDSLLYLYSTDTDNSLECVN